MHTLKGLASILGHIRAVDNLCAIHTHTPERQVNGVVCEYHTLHTLLFLVAMLGIELYVNRWASHVDAHARYLPNSQVARSLGRSQTSVRKWLTQ